MKKFMLLLVTVLIAAQVFSQVSVTVVTPNGGENWIKGCPAQIQWISSNTAGPVKIDLFRAGNFVMTLCSQAPAGVTSFIWFVSNALIPDTTYKIRVASLTSTANFDFSDGSFTISNGVIHVTSPNGGESWEKGTVHPVTWTDNICDNVRIELWKGAAFNMLIAASVPSNGLFTWAIPNAATLAAGNDYRIKIMGAVNSAGTTSMVCDFSDTTFTISQPQAPSPIVVVTPNGGENWIMGCPKLIQWITANTTVGPVKIELFKNNVFTTTICPQVPAGMNSFTWIAPPSLVAGTDYKVKVSSLTSAIAFDFSDANFSINRGNITVTSPNGGESWVKGTVHPILWTSNICDNVRIELWKGAALNSVIAASVPSNGTFNWLIPNVASLSAGTDYKIRIVAISAATNTTSIVYDFSDNTFAIVQAPAPGPITVVAPNGGESWIMGCTGLIQWMPSTSAAGVPVKIELFKNNIFTMTINASVPATQTSFSWIVPWSLPAGNDYKVKVTSLISPTIFDFSDANFSIIQGNITVTAPNGGETWAKGSMHPVLWNDNLCDNVRIELWKGNLFHSMIAQSVPSNGTFNWLIPNVNTIVPGNDYKIRIAATVNVAGTTGMVYDMSDNPFTILAGSSAANVDPLTVDKMFPNPAKDNVSITFSGTSETPVKIDIFDRMGVLVRSQSFSSIMSGETVVVDLSGLPAGTYLYNVSTLAGVACRGRLMVEP